MFFASDNGGPAHPKIMTRLAEDNAGYAMPYGNDPAMNEVREHVRALFNAPEAAVYLVATGTAANALALATYTQPFQSIYCSPVAHIEEDECGAPEFYTGGAKLVHVPGSDKMTPKALGHSIASTAQGVVHGVQKGPVSITQVTEKGGVYSLEDLAALTQTAKDAECPIHMDGARFANAVAALGTTARDMAQDVDVLCFGGTKNGCLGVEAVIFFDHAKAWEFELRRKRGGHLFSKHRHLSAQMAAYLKNDLWLKMATAANENAANLKEGLERKGARFDHPVEANMIFASLPRAAHQAALRGGARYYVMAALEGDDPAEMLPARFVCDWSITHDAIAQFIDLL